MVDITQETFKSTVSDKNVFDVIKDNALTTGEVKVIKDWNGLMLSILSGDTVILIEGWAEAISGSTRGGESRGVEEPSSASGIEAGKTAVEAIRTGDVSTKQLASYKTKIDQSFVGKNLKKYRKPIKS
ncbi:spore germination protein [Neobacillus drentensis]|uniref:spore germination protein n=1 Tax=Neobacillus drentensis TaxID=220684 RepID=UPI003002C44F